MLPTGSVDPSDTAIRLVIREKAVAGHDHRMLVIACISDGSHHLAPAQHLAVGLAGNFSWHDEDHFYLNACDDRLLASERDSGFANVLQRARIPLCRAALTIEDRFFPSGGDVNVASKRNAEWQPVQLGYRSAHLGSLCSSRSGNSLRISSTPDRRCHLEHDVAMRTGGNTYG
jgi:hypothetical protein